jgi:hypothetical protein
MASAPPPENVNRCRHDRFRHPGPLPEGEGIWSALRATFTVSFAAKIPGPSMRVGTVKMDFCYADYFGNEPSTGYETLIYDCMNGDATLYKHAECLLRNPAGQVTY